MSTHVSLPWCPRVSLVPTDEMFHVWKLLLVRRCFVEETLLCLCVCARTWQGATSVHQNTVTCVENVTEIVHLFCLALVPKSCTHTVEQCCSYPILSGLFMLSGRHSHLGQCPATAQFLAALASSQSLWRALQGRETTLPLSCLSPLPVKVRQSSLKSSSIAHSGNMF